MFYCLFWPGFCHLKSDTSNSEGDHNYSVCDTRHEISNRGGKKAAFHIREWIRKSQSTLLCWEFCNGFEHRYHTLSHKYRPKYMQLTIHTQFRSRHTLASAMKQCGVLNRDDILNFKLACCFDWTMCYDFVSSIYHLAKYIHFCALNTQILTHRFNEVTVSTSRLR